MVELLLSLNVNLDSRDAWKCSAIFYALNCADTAILKSLISRGAALDLFDKVYYNIFDCNFSLAVQLCIMQLDWERWTI